MRTGLAIFLVVAGCATPLLGCDAAFPVPNARAPELPLERIAVTGASLSSGLCAHSLAYKMREIAPSKAEVLDASDFFFFLSPSERGRSSVDEIVAFRPSFVIAIDFLFWFAYHEGSVDAGLTELERIDAPMIVGDIPWMAHAAPWLGLSVPDKPTLAAFNEQIRSWAVQHPNVTLVPLSAWVEEAYAGSSSREPWRLGVEAGSLVFIDNLHPTDEGADLILSRALDAAR